MSRNTPKAAVARSVGPLLMLLQDKYLYGGESFRGRVRHLPPLSLGQSAKEAFVLCTPGNRPFLLAVAATDKEAMQQAAVRHALETDTIGLLVVAGPDAQEIEVYRRGFDSPKFDRVAELEYWFRPSTGTQCQLLADDDDDPGECPPATGDVGLPISHKLENLFFDVHSCLRDIDGLHADSAVEELCKLLYVKAFIEEQGASTSEGRVHSSSFGSTEEYAAVIRGLYREASDYDLRVYRLKIPQYERSRGVFQSPFRLSSPALVKSFQLLENYSLRRSKADIKGRAFQKVLGRAVRAGMGQYFTPQEVCSFMVAVLNPNVKHLILDPFCGSGHFLSESLASVAAVVDCKSKAFHEFAFGKLHGIEKSDRMTRIAMTDMRLRGDGHSNIRCTDALLAFENYPDISPESFDIVVTNPPFGSLLTAEAISRLGAFELARGKKNVPLEILGLERAVAFLRPGGRLGIVLPDSVLSADSTTHVRAWLLQKMKLRAVVSLPAETFSPFGANVKTNVLFARKWMAGETASTDYKVCMVKVGSVGYDASGRLRKDCDLADAEKNIEAFLDKEGW